MHITLCGSTKFRDLFLSWNQRLTAAGHVVYSVAFDDKERPPSPELKLVLDAGHMAKIANSDAIFVITGEDYTPYLGESTRREIYFAQALGKNVVSDRMQAAVRGLLIPLNVLMSAVSARGNSGTQSTAVDDGWVGNHGGVHTPRDGGADALGSEPASGSAAVGVSGVRQDHVGCNCTR